MTSSTSSTALSSPLAPTSSTTPLPHCTSPSLPPLEIRMLNIRDLPLDPYCQSRLESNHMITMKS